MKVYPYEKGGGGRFSIAMLKGGHKKFGIFFSFSHTYGGEGAKSYGPAIFPFCSPPPPPLLPVINDQSLRRLAGSPLALCTQGEIMP